MRKVQTCREGRTVMSSDDQGWEASFMKVLCTRGGLDLVSVG